MRECCRFGLQRGSFHFCRSRHVSTVDQVQRVQVPVPRKLIRIGKADMSVFWRDPCHVDGTFGHFGNCLRSGVRRGDGGLAPAEQHAKADLDALGAFRVLQCAVSHFDRDGMPLDRDGIRCFCARPCRRVEEGICQFG